MNSITKTEQEKLTLFKQYGYDISKARRFVLNKARITQGRILEIGTGRGHLAIALAKKGLRLTSVDVDRAAQKAARANLKAAQVGRLATLKIMDAEKLNYQDNSFDQVISVNFIHHAQRPQQCIKEMVRVAKHSIVIADLNKHGEAIMDRVHGLEGHQHEQTRMSLNKIKAYLEKLGLSVQSYRDTCQTVFVAKKG